MQVPVVFDNNGSINFFRSLKDAVLYLEPIDVENDVQNHKNVAYDVTGRCIAFNVRDGRVVADYIEDTPTQAKEVERLLRASITYVNPDLDVRSLSMEELVEIISQWPQTGEWYPSRFSIFRSNLSEWFASNISKLFTGKKPPKV